MGLRRIQFNEKQECIPVGCVPPALYRRGGVFVQGGSLSRGVSVRGERVCPGSLSKGGLCPGGGSLSRRGVSVQEGVSVQGGLSRGSLSWGVSQGGSVREPPL